MHTKSTAPNTSKASFKPRVRRLGQGRYLVESASKPGVGHPVTADYCPCKGFSYRGTCRHIALVREIAPRMDAWYAQAVPATMDTSDTRTDTERRLDRALAALSDTSDQDDAYATLLRQVDDLERQVAADNAYAMRAA